MIKYLWGLYRTALDRQRYGSMKQNNINEPAQKKTSPEKRIHNPYDWSMRRFHNGNLEAAVTEFLGELGLPVDQKGIDKLVFSQYPFKLERVNDEWVSIMRMEVEYPKAHVQKMIESRVVVADGDIQWLNS